MMDYELNALLYAEKYGIIDYKVKGSKMTYYETYPNEGTFKAVVDLKTMKETRTHLKRKYNKHCC
jgi:hypothetical protein